MDTSVCSKPKKRYACKYQGCKNKFFYPANKNKRNPSFHHFPTDDELQKLWKINCGIPIEENCYNYRICERHFKPGDTDDFSLRRRLVKGAVPVPVTETIHNTGVKISKSAKDQANVGRQEVRSPVAIIAEYEQEDETSECYKFSIDLCRIIGALDKICLVCFSECELVPLEKENTVQMYESFTCLKINVCSGNTPKPTYICNTCILGLQEAVEFKNKCIKSFQFFNTLSAITLKEATDDALTICRAVRENERQPATVLETSSFDSNWAKRKKSKLAKEYTCKICNKHVQGSRFFGEHMKAHNPFTCSQCHMKIKDYGVFKYHMRNFHKGPYTCTKCKTEFKFRHLLVYHQRSECPTMIPPCSLCKAKFSSRPRLIRHMYDIHQLGNKRTGINNVEKVMCEMCAEMIPVHYLKIHILKRHLNCQKCGRKFRTRIEQKQHDCDNPFPHKCQYCDKSFEYKQKLNMHLVIKHQTEHPYHCHLCDKKFKLGFKLKSHIRTHTGEKPYQCNECNKRFRDQQYLRKHRYRIHTEPTPQNNFQPPVPRYACDYCNERRFTRRAIQTHILSHTGELPYLCKLCNIGFKTAFSFYRHNKRYHSNVNSDNDLTANNSSQKSSLPSRWNYRLLQCTLCHLNFFYMKNLEAHLIHCRDQHGLLNVGDLENYYITLKNGVNDLYEEDEKDGVVETEGVEEGDDVYVYVTDMKNVNESEQAIANLYNYKEIHDIVEQ